MSVKETTYDPNGHNKQWHLLISETYFIGGGGEFAKHKVLVRRINEWVCGKVKGVSDHYIWIAWGTQGRYYGTTPLANFCCLHIARCLISSLSCATHLHSVAIEIQPMEERQHRLP